MKCDSCSSSFDSSLDLFQHIQDECLHWYEKHPHFWTNLLSILAKNKKESKDKETIVDLTCYESIEESVKEKDETPHCSRDQSPETSQTSTSSRPYICPICNTSLQTFDAYNVHSKTCCPATNEPPFCILFHPLKKDKKKQASSVHMTLKEYFYASKSGRRTRQGPEERRASRAAYMRQYRAGMSEDRLARKREKDAQRKRFLRSQVPAEEEGGQQVTDSKEESHEKLVPKKYTCYSCSKTLRNNIRFMSHVRHKIINQWEENENINDFNICQHCYRRFGSPFQLQCHVETVHAFTLSPCTCRICELNFDSECSLLHHMKDSHVYNEMPYACKACNYSSSFYNDVMVHFRDVHFGSSVLMCPFCLAVQHQGNTFLKHVLQHIKKQVQCKRCRLQFVNSKDMLEHLRTDHNSNDIRSKKHKNLRDFQVFVRVSDNPLPPGRPAISDEKNDDKIKENSNNKTQVSGSKKTTNNEDKRPTEKIAFRMSSSTYTGSSVAPSSVDLPEYMLPVTTDLDIEKINLPVSHKCSYHICIECDCLIDPDDFDSHFNKSYECRWCVYRTSCKRSSRAHVLREHADAELKESLIEKENSKDLPTPLLDPISDQKGVEKATVDLSNEDEIIDELPTNDIISSAANQELDSDEKSQEDVKLVSEESTLEHPKLNLKKRRKQPNPMKHLDNEVESSKKVRIEDEKNVVVDQTVATACQIKKLNTLKQKTGEGKSITNSSVNGNSAYEGWIAYFKRCENNRTRKFEPAPAKNTLPTMVAASTTTVAKCSTEVSMIPPMVPLKAKQVLVPVTLSASMASQINDDRPIYRFQIMDLDLNDGELSKPRLALLPSNASPASSMQKNYLLQMVSPPVNLRCLGRSPSSLLLSWEKPSNCEVSQFELAFQGVCGETTQILPSSQTLVRLIGLKPDILYSVRVFSLHEERRSLPAQIVHRTDKLPQSQPVSSPSVTLFINSDLASMPRILPKSSVPANAKILKPSLSNVIQRLAPLPTRMTSSVIASVKIVPKADKWRKITKAVVTSTVSKNQSTVSLSTFASLMPKIQSVMTGTFPTLSTATISGNVQPPVTSAQSTVTSMLLGSKNNQPILLSDKSSMTKSTSGQTSTVFAQPTMTCVRSCDTISQIHAQPIRSQQFTNQNSIVGEVDGIVPKVPSFTPASTEVETNNVSCFSMDKNKEVEGHDVKDHGQNVAEKEKIIIEKEVQLNQDEICFDSDVGKQEEDEQRVSPWLEALLEDSVDYVDSQMTQEEFKDLGESDGNLQGNIEMREDSLTIKRKDLEDSHQDECHDPGNSQTMLKLANSLDLIETKMREQEESFADTQMIEKDDLKDPGNSKIVELEEPQNSGDSQILEMDDMKPEISVTKMREQEESFADTQMIEKDDLKDPGNFKIVELEEPQNSGDSQILEMDDMKPEISIMFMQGDIKDPGDTVGPEKSLSLGESCMIQQKDSQDLRDFVTFQPLNSALLENEDPVKTLEEAPDSGDSQQEEYEMEMKVVSVVSLSQQNE